MAVYSGCCWGCGHPAWWARLTCHLGILALMTRGAARRRRAGLRRAISRRRKVSHRAPPASLSSGGKSALVRHGLAGDPERGDEADPVRVVAAVPGGVGHQGSDRKVTAQVSPDLLEHQVRGFGAQHGAGSALVGLELVEGELDLPALDVGRSQFGGRGRSGIQDGGAVSYTHLRAHETDSYLV